MPASVHANAAGCILRRASWCLCEEPQPLFKATAVQESNFSGQSATWTTVIKKRVADVCNFTDILRNAPYSVPHFSILTSWKQTRKEKEKRENIKRKQKLTQF